MVAEKIVKNIGGVQGKAHGVLGKFGVAGKSSDGVLHKALGKKKEVDFDD